MFSLDRAVKYERTTVKRANSKKPFQKLSLKNDSKKLFIAKKCIKHMLTTIHQLASNHKLPLTGKCPIAKKNFFKKSFKIPINVMRSIAPRRKVESKSKLNASKAVPYANTNITSQAYSEAIQKG